MARVNKIWGGFCVYSSSLSVTCLNKCRQHRVCIPTKKTYVGPAIAAVEVSRSTRSHPIENVRPLFYSKSTMLNIVESLIVFSGLCLSRTKGIVISLLTCACSPNSTFGGAAGVLRYVFALVPRGEQQRGEQPGALNVYYSNAQVMQKACARACGATICGKTSMPRFALLMTGSDGYDLV
jgi:hypothetical protein